MDHIINLHPCEGGSEIAYVGTVVDVLVMAGGSCVIELQNRAFITSGSFDCGELLAPDNGHGFEDLFGEVVWLEERVKLGILRLFNTTK